MSKIKNKIKTFYNLLAQGEFLVILKIIKDRIYSNIYFYYFRKDLSFLEFVEIPKTQIDFKLRPYQDKDAVYFKNLPLDDMLINANISTCYVAETSTGEVCYRQWFIEPSQNDKIKAFFGHNFPELKKDECIFERVHVTEKYRGQHIALTANIMLVKKALSLGYKWGVGCIDPENTSSLKAAAKAYVVPDKLQVTRWRFFRMDTIYIDVPKKFKDKHPWLFTL